VRRGARPGGVRFLGLVPAVILAGCAATPEAARSAAGVLPPEGAPALIQRWEAEWRAFPGLRAAADLDVTRRGRSHRTAAVVLLSPTQLRFEALTPFGLPALVVVAASDRLTVFSAVERRAWVGRPTPTAMARWVGLPVDPEALIRLLVGRTPLPPDAAAARAEPRPSPHVAFERSAATYRVWTGVEGYPLQVQVEDGTRLTVVFERRVDGGLEGLTAEVPAQALRAQLRYLAIEAVAPPPEAFELVIPPGVPIESVG